MFVSLAGAQEKDAQEKEKNPRDGLEWAVALRGRFREMHNPVVATYALGRLASLVCAKDRTAGSGLFREALTRLNMLPDRAFSDAGPVRHPSCRNSVANLALICLHRGGFHRRNLIAPARRPCADKGHP